MGKKYYYTYIENTYLGVSKELKGQSRYELELKVLEQTRKWNEKERDNVKEKKSRI